MATNFNDMVSSIADLDDDSVEKPKTAAEKDEQKSKSLRALLKRKGVRSYDPTTEEGQMIEAMIDQFTSIADSNLPDAVVAQLAETLVSSILLQRSCMTHLLNARRPSTRDDDDGEVKRKAFVIAMNGFKATSELMIRMMEQLGITRKTLPMGRGGGLEDALRELSGES